MTVALCAHRFPDGTFCKRRALNDSRFCGYHRADDARFPDLPEFVEHSDVHPLARLSDLRDIFNVVRETLNAARQGRLPPGQVYAVGYMTELWLRVHDRMDYKERQLALDSQYLPKVLEAEAAAAAAAEAPLALPVKIDQQAAVEQVAATVELNLKPPTDYPGYVPPPDESPDGEPRDGRQMTSPGREPWARGGTQLSSSLPQAVAEAAGPEQLPSGGSSLHPESSILNPDSRSALVEKILEHTLGPLRGDPARPGGERKQRKNGKEGRRRP